MPKVKRYCEEIKNLIKNKLDWFEKRKIEEVNEILHKIQHEFGDHLTLQNPETGELIDTDELARVRGILSFLTETENFVVELKSNWK
jgi:hypothetical protein